MPKPITTTSDFLNALVAARKKLNIEFTLVRSRFPRRNREGKLVNRQVLYYRARTGSLWDPVAVVAWAWYSPPDGPWHRGHDAATLAGMPMLLCEEILLAAMDDQAAAPSLRVNLLKAAGFTAPPKYPPFSLHF